MSDEILREEQLFSVAIELPKTERDAYLKGICALDTDLYERLVCLLRAHDQAEGFLESDHSGSFSIGRSIQQSAPCDEVPGDQIGRYKLLEKIGEGGWGVVWMAEQRSPVSRRVALKVIKLGMDTKEVVARFESERQALAMMDHPNIAKVYDGGSSPSGRPYFVMELVRGIRITDHCDREKLSTHDRLKLFIRVCQAVQHAHQKGVIHRDLKPSNILVTINDGKAVPKVIDFGVVKATQHKLSEKTYFTRFHSFVGTPVYTSPEQMQMSSLDVDTRSDIYSLGVLLYELLTGKPPFNPSRLSELGIDAMRKVISEESPPRPSEQATSLNQEERTIVADRRSMEVDQFPKELKGDLDIIVMKCLAKNRSRRYETVNALAMDLQRFLDREPILARKPSNFYKLRKLVQRNRLAFGFSVALAISLVAGAVTSAYLARQAIESEQHAQEEARNSEEISSFIKSMFSYVDTLVELQMDNEINTQTLRETLKETFDRAALRLENSSQGAMVEICDILGAMYFKIREYERAESLFRKELLNLRNAAALDYSKLARTMNHLAAALGRQGILQEAETSIREALAIQQSQSPIDNRDVARSLVNLSVIQVKKASGMATSPEKREALLLEAQESVESALALQTELYGGEHVEIAASLHELGFVLACRGGEFLPRAQSVVEKALAMNRRLIGDENPAVASGLNLLAIAKIMQGKYKEAVADYRSVQAMRERLEDSRPTGLLTSYEVSVWEHQNTSEESLEALHDVIALTIPRFEFESAEVANFLAVEAFAYVDDGQYRVAEEKARTCLEIRGKLSPDIWTFFHAHSLLGSALLGQGRLEEAEPHLIAGFEGIKARRDQLGDEHASRLVESLLRLMALYKQKRDQEAMQVLAGEAKVLGLSLTL